jgi:sulfur transfer complex TusBCD TusB component (DsrH family)
MARKFLTPIDLNKLELQNAAIQNLATDPGSPVAGQVYYNTAIGKLKVYNGSSWVEVGNSQEQIEDAIANLVVAGTGINEDYDDNAGTLTISNTGVVSLSGTENEVTVSASAGAVTVSLPDTISADISGTAASATYAVTAGTANAVAADSVALGTDTTGDYVADVSAGSGISVTGTGEGASVTVTNTGVTSITGTANEVNVSAASGAVTIGLPDDVTIAGDLTVSGDLTISGSATYVNTEIIELDDNTIILNANATTASEDAGIEVERGTVETNVSLLWNESNDNWTLTNDGTNYHAITRKYSVNVGDTSNTVFALDHNLGTRDVTVQVYDNSTYDTVEVDVVRTSDSRVTVSFATAPGNDAYRVVIVG